MFIKRSGESDGEVGVEPPVPRAIQAQLEDLQEKY